MKRNWYSKNKFYEIEKIRQHLKCVSGVDLSLVDAFGVSLVQTVILECGTDMTKFPSEKHFCAWLGVAPKHEISGNKVLKNTTLKTKKRAGQAFRMAAQSMKQAEYAFACCTDVCEQGWDLPRLQWQLHMPLHGWSTGC